MKGITLILGSSEQYLYIVFAQDTEIVCAQEWLIHASGSELLAPAITDILQKINIFPQNISRISCISGPGSFSGLRLILATTTAMRRTLNIPVATLNYLEVLAASSWPLLSPQNSITLHAKLRIVTYARQQLVYVQDFRLDESLPVPITEPQVLPITDVIQISEPTLFVGSGVKRNYTYFQEQAQTNHAIFLYPQPISVSSSALVQLTERIMPFEWQENDPEPLYLRPSDAVENLSSIAIRNGQNPDHAHSELENLLKQDPLSST